MNFSFLQINAVNARHFIFIKIHFRDSIHRKFRMFAVKRMNSIGKEINYAFVPSSGRNSVEQMVNACDRSDVHFPKNIRWMKYFLIFFFFCNSWPFPQIFRFRMAESRHTFAECEAKCYLFMGSFVWNVYRAAMATATNAFDHRPTNMYNLYSLKFKRMWKIIYSQRTKKEMA